MLRIWDVAQGEIIATLSASKLEDLDFRASLITAVTYMNKDTELISVRADGMIYRLNATTGGVLASTHLNGSAYAAAFSPDGSQIAYGGEGSSIQIVSVADALMAKAGE